MQELLMELGNTAEKAINKQLGANEKIIAKLKGDGTQALVITAKRVYVLKWGYALLFNTQCRSFEYTNIEAIDLQKKWVYGIIRIITPSYKKADDDIFFESSNAKISDNAVTFSKKMFPLYLEAANLIEDYGSSLKTPSLKQDSLEQLEKLGKLRKEGVITQSEFEAKKKILLDL